MYYESGTVDGIASGQPAGLLRVHENSADGSTSAIVAAILTPHFLAVWGPNVNRARTPHFLVPCCYRPTWRVIHSISSADSG